MNIFIELNYKKILKKALLERKKHVSKSFNYQNMAKACAVQKTYLSKVLNKEGNLSSDQLYKALKFLEFNREEINYTYLLYEYENSQIKERKKDLALEIRSIQEKYQKTDTYIKAESQEYTSSELNEYYLDPYMQIVHIFLTIPKYRNNPLTIQNLLNLNGMQFGLIINKLIKLGIIVLEDGQYKIIKDHMHLSSNSNIVKPYKIMLRLKTIEMIQKLSDNKMYNFSVLFSTTPKIKKNIQKKFLEFLKDIEPLVKDSEAKSIYQMNFDLFSWDNSH